MEDKQLTEFQAAAREYEKSVKAWRKAQAAEQDTARWVDQARERLAAAHVAMHPKSGGVSGDG